jgi:hypothetical protein
MERAILLIVNQRHNEVGGALKLSREVGGVVNDMSAGMASPAVDHLGVELTSELSSLGAHAIVGECVEGFGSVGSRNQVEHHVVAESEEERRQRDNQSMQIKKNKQQKEHRG